MPCRTRLRLRAGAGVRAVPAAVTSLPRKTNSGVPPSVVCSLAFSLSLSRPPDGSGAVAERGCTSSLACRARSRKPSARGLMHASKVDRDGKGGKSFAWLRLPASLALGTKGPPSSSKRLINFSPAASSRAAILSSITLLTHDNPAQHQNTCCACCVGETGQYLSPVA